MPEPSSRRVVGHKLYRQSRIQRSLCLLAGGGWRFGDLRLKDKGSPRLTIVPPQSSVVRTGSPILHSVDYTRIDQQRTHVPRCFEAAIDDALQSCSDMGNDTAQTRCMRHTTLKAAALMWSSTRPCRTSIQSLSLRRYGMFFSTSMAPPLKRSEMLRSPVFPLTSRSL